MAEQRIRRNRRQRAGAAALVFALQLSLGLALALSGLFDTDSDRSAGAASLPPVEVSVRIDARSPGRPVPQRFLGLSFELAELRTVASYGLHGDVVQLLRSLGPGMIRFGGVSADSQAAWVDAQDPKPAWARSEFDAADLRNLATLARRSGWTVLLTIGLGHYRPGAAAREVAAAHAILGPYLAAIEIGNEPDSYGRHGLRRASWNARAYNGEVHAYRAAIARTTPGIPLAGPDVSGSLAFERWGALEVADQHPAILTGHHYPLRCKDTPPASITRLLSAPTREAEQVSLARFVGLARRSGVPIRIDEANTVSCGGTAGISDTFASALWATSYLTRAMAAGVAGINLEDNPARCTGYSVLCASSPQQVEAGNLHVQPEWYALLLASRLISDRPVRAVTSARPQANIFTAALLAPGRGLDLVVVDGEPAGTQRALVHARVGLGYSSATITQLSGPSLGALSQVTLGARPVAAQGSWPGPSSVREITVHGGVADIPLPAASAELVQLSP